MRDQFRLFSDEKLLRIVGEEATDYTQEALDAARQELQCRHIAYAVPQVNPAEPEVAVAVSNIETAPQSKPLDKRWFWLYTRVWLPICICVFLVCGVMNPISLIIFLPAGILFGLTAKWMITFKPKGWYLNRVVLGIQCLYMFTFFHSLNSKRIRGMLIAQVFVIAFYVINHIYFEKSKVWCDESSESKV